MDRVRALLEGGRVQRLHAQPHLRPYSVAEHSWGMAMMLLALYPGQPSRGLLWACLTHDVAERWTGDIPAPAKWHVVPGLCLPLRQAEEHINERLGIDWPLSTEERHWLKALDLAELYVYCRDAHHMGDRFMRPMCLKCLEILEDEWVPVEVQTWVLCYHPERTPDSFDMEE